MIEVGDVIRDCRVVGRLRAGGMATLFLARRSGLAGFERQVAIKVVHHHLADDPAFVEMFLDEARLSARIHHPNVVHVEELGEADGTYYLVMEYVDGCSLQQLLAGAVRRGVPLGPELAVAIALQVADGLHAAHETLGASGESLEIIHRDVSPQNVLLGYNGHVKLIDFGVARSRGRTAQTQDGGLKGKLQYMSPEQAWADAVDRRSDVYALGIVLWEMLTLQRLFTGESDIALLERVRHPQIARPSEHAPGIPPALDEAVMAALAPIPAARPASARAFRQRLAEAVPAALALDNAQIAAVVRELVPRTAAPAASDGGSPSRVHTSRLLFDADLAPRGRAGSAAGARRRALATGAALALLVASAAGAGTVVVTRDRGARSERPTARAVPPPLAPPLQPPAAARVDPPSPPAEPSAAPDATAPAPRVVATPSHHHHASHRARVARAPTNAVLHGAHGVPIVDDHY